MIFIFCFLCVIHIFIRLARKHSSYKSYLNAQLNSWYHAMKCLELWLQYLINTQVSCWASILNKNILLKYELKVQFLLLSFNFLDKH